MQTKTKTKTQRKFKPQPRKVRQVDNLMRKEERAGSKLTASYHSAEINALMAPTRSARPKKKVKNASRLLKTEAAHPVPSCPILNLSGAPRPTFEGLQLASRRDQLAVDAGQYNSALISAATPWASAVMNGFSAANSDARYPDPFTLVRTSMYQITSKYNINPHDTGDASSGVYSYALHGIFKGSGAGSFAVAEHAYAALPAMVWSSYVAETNPNGLTWYDSGLASSAHFTRPNGMVLGIKPHLRGIAHSVSVFAVPVMAATIAEHTAYPTGWPTYPQLGLTSAQSMWGGRSWTFNPNDEQVRLVCLPYDARSLDFCIANQERAAVGAAANQAWSEWLFWIYGMGAGDIVEFTSYVLEEGFARSNTTQVYLTPSAFKAASSPIRDKSINSLGEMATLGMQAIKIAATAAVAASTMTRTLFGMNWRGALTNEILGSTNKNFTECGPSVTACAPRTPEEVQKGAAEAGLTTSAWSNAVKCPPPDPLEEEMEEIKDDRRPRFRSDSIHGALQPPPRPSTK